MFGSSSETRLETQQGFFPSLFLFLSCSLTPTPPPCAHPPRDSPPTRPASRCSYRPPPPDADMAQKRIAKVSRATSDEKERGGFIAGSDDCCSFGRRRRRGRPSDSLVCLSALCPPLVAWWPLARSSLVVRPRLVAPLLVAARARRSSLSLAAAVAPTLVGPLDAAPAAAAALGHLLPPACLPSVLPLAVGGWCLASSSSFAVE